MKLRISLLVTLFVLYSSLAWGTAFTSTGTGAFEDGATWGNNSPGVEGTDYPGSADTFTIANTHVVTASGTRPSAGDFGASQVSTGGTLAFATAASTTFTISGNLTVQDGAHFYIGTSGSPVTAGNTATFIISSATDALVKVDCDGDMSAYGAALTYWKTTLDGDAAIGDKSITTTDSTGWTVGDEIYILYKKGALASSDSEMLDITGISGTTIYFDQNGDGTGAGGAGSSLAAHHADDIDIFNLTARNVIVKSVDATHRGWIDGDDHDGFTFGWALFKDLYNSTGAIYLRDYDYTDTTWSDYCTYYDCGILQYYNVDNTIFNHSIVYSAVGDGVYHSYYNEDSQFKNSLFCEAADDGFDDNRSNNTISNKAAIEMDTCWFYDNNDYGIDTGAGGTSRWHIDCKWVHNGGSGCQHRNYGYYENCEFSANGAAGHYHYTSGTFMFINCDFGTDGTNSADFDGNSNSFYARIMGWDVVMSSATELQYTAGNLQEYAYCHISKYDGTEGRSKHWQHKGIISDNDTASITARGGSGKCLVLDPDSTTEYLAWNTIENWIAPVSFYIPCTDSTAVTVSFYHKVSASFDGTLLFSVKGAGVTEVWRGSVSLTDDNDWHQYTSSSMTPTEDGLIAVTLECKDGSTSGEIYIDDISISAGADISVLDFGEWAFGSPSQVMFDATGGGGTTNDVFGWVD